LLSLDVHAITELQDKKVPRTNDNPKYSYKAKESKDSAYGNVLDLLILGLFLTFVLKNFHPVPEKLLLFEWTRSLLIMLMLGKIVA